MGVKANLNLMDSKLFKDVLEASEEFLQNAANGNKLYEDIGDVMQSAHKNLQRTFSDLRVATDNATVKSFKYDKEATASAIESLVPSVFSDGLATSSNIKFAKEIDNLGHDTAVMTQKIINEAANNIYSDNYEELGELMSMSSFSDFVYSQSAGGMQFSTYSKDIVAQVQDELLNNRNILNSAKSYTAKTQDKIQTYLRRGDKNVMPFVDAANTFYNAKSAGRAMTTDEKKSMLTSLGIGMGRAGIPVAATAGTIGVGTSVVHNIIEEKRGNRYYGY